MTSDTIAEIRSMRGFAIPWHVIARRKGRTVEECRAALNLPQYEASEPQVKPWDVQRGLFDDQPQRQEISER